MREEMCRNSKELRVENFPKIGKEMDIQIYKAQRIMNSICPKRSTLKHIIIQLSKVKRENIESSKRKATHFVEVNSHQAVS